MTDLGDTDPTDPADRRRIAFVGAINFRDLGGYPTRDGRSTRWGRVYRSDALHQLTDADLATYSALGVKMVYDLRGDEERTTRPSRVPSEGVYLMKAVHDSGASPFDAASVTDRRGGEQLLRDMYVSVLEHAGPVIGSVIGGMAVAERLPAVFNCHAGKDRTGVVAALLLEALGVEREAVLDDFELTGRYCGQLMGDGTFNRLVSMGVVPEAATGVLGAPRWTMEAALDMLDSRFGGAEPYLTGPAGLTPSTLRALRDNLVE